MAEVEIYSASVCPFAHRTRLTLLEKGVDFKLTEIDLKNKPDWFISISPYGKVPVIKHGDNTVWESAIINEYLDEVFTEPPLLPKDAGERALARIWIDFANTKFVPAFYNLRINEEREKQQESAQTLHSHLLFMEKEGIAKLSGNGPYWFGESLSLVDLSFYPWFERFPILEHYRSFALPSECVRLRQWWEAMSNRESVQAIKNTPDFYIEQYLQYANNTTTGITAQEMRLA
ncbi:glutathione S-transferase family protein [Aerosakkonema funiforme]|uniref:glutathione transferase n=1 Tax=Aerosakkonema funiforme FACHB-1375 TaxID=2949571 RepID=A0A926VL72_9CYAN|nr:glutathione S-transferase family protein [Aerosakkonema funiforme]MBD2185972.1 glutathione S-transferase family protein [Aerosakkonema funiforme FACHB-1375]